MCQGHKWMRFCGLFCKSQWSRYIHFKVIRMRLSVLLLFKVSQSMVWTAVREGKGWLFLRLVCDNRLFIFWNFVISSLLFCSYFCLFRFVLMFYCLFFFRFFFPFFLSLFFISCPLWLPRISLRIAEDNFWVSGVSPHCKFAPWHFWESLSS